MRSRRGTLSSAGARGRAGVVPRQLDDDVARERDTGRFKLKERRERSITTRVGEVRFQRRYYWDEEESRWVYLLDESLGLEKQERASEGFRAEAVVAAVKGRSYRSAKGEMARRFGHSAVSHEGVRQWTIQAGERLQEAKAYACEHPAGQRRVPVLFVDVDGFWPSLQREERREVKILTAHEGWQARYAGSKEFSLVNRRDYVEARGEAFWDDASRWLWSQYDLSQTWVVINGDRAGWIGEGVQWFPQALYQVDRFHAKRDIRRAMRGQGQRLQAALEALDANDIEKLERTLAAAWQELGPESPQGELLRGLLQDLRRRPEAWRDYRVRLAERQVSTEGYRGMGSAEASVERYSARLRKVGRSWSVRGLAGLVEAMAAAFTGLEKLVNAVHRTSEDTGLADRLQTLKKKAIDRTVARIEEELGKVRQGHFPALDVGTGASGGLARIFRHVIDATPI